MQARAGPVRGLRVAGGRQSTTEGGDAAVPRTRILAIDDQLYFRVYLEDLLDQEGYEVTTVSTVDEALAQVQANVFDVILTDLAIPGADGPELVRRLRERAADPAIVVLTSVGDVHVAVEAMKVGATDYLLKPIDRTVLAHTLEELLQQRQMRAEHASLLAENLEFMGAVSLYERALGLFSELSLEALADRVVEGLCLETQAHGGVLWMARSGDPRRLRLLGARGLVRAEQELPEIDLDALPAPLGALGEPVREPFEAGAVRPGEAGGDRSLYVPLVVDDRLLGIARLTDKVDGDFDDLDRAAARKFAGFAARAAANALEMRALERRSFRDPVTRTYTRAYFDDVARNELQKASRFGRLFSFLVVELGGVSGSDAGLSETERARWLEGVAFQIGRCLRATDLLATDLTTGDRAGRFCMLLPETDALGAAILKRRVRAALERSEELQRMAPGERPQVSVASATHPADGTETDAIWRSLEARLREDRESVVRKLDLAAMDLPATLDRLLGEARPGRPESVEQVAKFLLSEIGRRPYERGVFFVAPGPGLQAALRDGLDSLRGLEPRTEIVVLDDNRGASYPGLPLTWAGAGRLGEPPPFLVRFGEGVPYALVHDPDGGDGSDASAAIYHTSDRALVEQLAFQLGSDLGIPMGE